MSDPMTNTEVEDVLASIRRLVSDDNRPAPESAATASSDRLVLTPALRVTEEVEEGRDLPEDAEAAADEAIDSVDVLEDDLPEDGEVAFQPADEMSAPTGDEVEEASFGDDDMGQADALAPEEHPIALDAVDLDQDTLMSIQDAFDDVDDSASADETVEAEPALQDESTTLSAKIAALETLIAGQTEEFEPEKAGDGANAGTEPPALAWEDADDEVSTPDPSPDVEPVPEAAKSDGAQIFSSDEDVLDEEALRDLVSDIVREELQGALGERITRNVRKLVRREIHRALAAQDLE
ncbi:hypothetical protein GCM10007385_24960 [Tateyamaria omphalii]|uniref:hypothetical protein n=1 Tax=Tateyamaria omphalii TaxID=299262 RepID=UPI00199AABE7|nr:hypothetical protein [Tateyamaria omphalii]GGX55416.1 hypothetical protein GCM10007385_24960 [Tateyamaria omphalii]